MKAIGIARSGRLDFGDYNKKRIAQDIKENEGAKYELQRLTVESKELRGFYEGGVIALWVFLDGNDWRDSRVHQHYHDQANREFNGEIIIRNKKPEKMGKSSKGKLIKDGLCEKVIEYLEDNYGIDRNEVLDPEKYKNWLIKIFPYGGLETYIEYLLSINKLHLPDAPTRI